MKIYKVFVHVEADNGREIVVSHKFPANDEATVKTYVKGFETGAAVAHDGAVLDTEVFCLGDYLKVRELKNL